MNWRPECFELLVWQRIDKLLEEELIYGDIDDHEAQLFSYGVEAGADAMYKAIVEWLAGDCMKHSEMESLGVALEKRFRCFDCWQELREGQP